MSLARALYEYRTLDRLDAVEEILQGHQASSFTLDLIRKYREEQTDALNSLSNMVLPLREEGATLATQFSDYIGPTLSMHYDAVVVLIIAGMNPASSRDTINSVRRFLAFARKTGPLPHCLKARRFEAGPNAPYQCVETYKLVVIHFDSFCSQFCQPHLCLNPAPRTCSDASASEGLDFLADREAWCQNPCTRVVAHYKQGPASSADKLLPQLPQPPSIIDISVGAQEQDPKNQRVHMQLGPLASGVVSVRLRIIHHEFDKAANEWIPVHGVQDTHTPELNVTIGQLISGRYYYFQAAAVNDVGEGPYSARWPESASGLLVGHRIVTIQPEKAVRQPLEHLDTCDAEEAAGSDLTNRAPNWLAWAVRLSFSELPRNQEPAASVEFFDLANGTTFNCLKFQLDPSDSLAASCRIPCRESRFTSTLAVTVWDSNRITKIAEGQLTHEPMSKASCGAFTPSRPLFCDVEDSRQRRCMVPTSINGSACDLCFDARTPKTYRVESRLCTGFQCQLGERWCPLNGIGCITTSCQVCYTGSVDFPVDGGTVCALPCELYADVPDLIVENGAISVPPGDSAKIACDAGLGPSWDEALGAPGPAELQFLCPEGNTRLEYKVSDLARRPACKPRCVSGTFQDVDGYIYTYGDSIYGQTMNFTCDASQFESGMVVLLCKDSVVELLSRTCKVGGVRKIRSHIF